MADDLNAKHVDCNSRQITTRGRLLRYYADENSRLIYWLSTPTIVHYNSTDNWCPTHHYHKRPGHLNVSNWILLGFYCVSGICLLTFPRHYGPFKCQKLFTQQYSVTHKNLILQHATSTSTLGTTGMVLIWLLPVNSNLKAFILSLRRKPKA